MVLLKKLISWIKLIEIIIYIYIYEKHFDFTQVQNNEKKNEIDQFLTYLNCPTL